MKTILFYLSLAFLFSCSINEDRRESKSDTDLLDNKIQIKSSVCFQNLLKYAENNTVSGNTFVMHGSSKYDNYRKFTAINDSQYIFSAGSRYKEVILDTLKCQYGFPRLKLIHEDYDFMHFGSGCGTNCWWDIILDFYNDTIYYTQAFYVDTNRLRFVEIEQPNLKPIFRVYDVHNKTCDTLFSEFETWLPSLGISDVKLSNDEPWYLSYTAVLQKNDSMIYDTLWLYQ